MTPLSITSASSYGSPVVCPTSLQACAQLPTVVCAFDRNVKHSHLHGGRDCIQVHKADMQEIARHDLLQQFKTNSSGVLSDRTVYFPNENYSYHATPQILRCSMHQREVYPHEPWDWHSSHMKNFTSIPKLTCQRPCSAAHCTDVRVLAKHKDLIIDLEKTEKLPISLIIGLSAVGIIGMAVVFNIFMRNSKNQSPASKAETKYSMVSQKQFKL